MGLLKILRSDGTWEVLSDDGTHITQDAADARYIKRSETSGIIPTIKLKTWTAADIQSS